MHDQDVQAKPRLTDGVIVLDTFRLEDLDAQLAGDDEEQARRFGWYPATSTPETVRQAILRWQENWQTGGPTRAFAVRQVATGELVGGCEVRLKEPGLAHLSYWVFPAHRRRGLASRAVRLACGYAFAELGVERLELSIEADNVASQGVARRAGFTEQGVLRDRVGEMGDAPRARDMLRYVRLASRTGRPGGAAHRPTQREVTPHS